MDAAEHELEGRPPSYQMGYLAAARVLQAAVQLYPDRVATAADRAFGIVCALPNVQEAAELQIEIQAFRMVSLLDCGDPAGFTLLDEVEHYAASSPRPATEETSALLNAYMGSVIALYQQQADDLFDRFSQANQRFELGWLARAEPYRLLEFVQCGRYEEARQLFITVTAPLPGTMEAAVFAYAEALRELRSGSLARARGLLDAIGGVPLLQVRALQGLARLELALLEDDPALAELARRLYERTEPRRYARAAGFAAVGLASAGQSAPPVPAWLAESSPPHVFWDWALGIADSDTRLLREVSQRLSAMMLPYEAALALRDAGDLNPAYRAFSELGAVTARQQTAARLRASDQRVPRHTHAALQRGGLTDTEREVTAQLAVGSTNEAIADRLGISVRTVEAHLTHIYQKIGRRGRVALAAWWREEAP
ncbi:MAG: response regulator transcription factor [Dehalococcoidia bacterium]